MTPPAKKLKPVAVQLRPDVAERARDAAVALSGPPLALTVTSLVNEATDREVIRLQNEYNGGKKFPRRSTGVRKGRPIVR